MKKTLVILGCVLASLANAASFDWGTGATKASFGSTVFNSDTYNVTAGLVYLGNKTPVDMTKLFTVDYSGTGSITTGTDADTASPTVTGGNANKGKIKSTFDGTSVANGSIFGMYIKYNDGSKDWYNLSSTTYTVSGIVVGNEILPSAEFAFDFSTTTTVTSNTQTVSAGGGWYTMAVAVPEPATGALALAGIALLLKRRKAAKA